jgi:hypothetical protein
MTLDRSPATAKIRPGSLTNVGRCSLNWCPLGFFRQSLYEVGWITLVDARGFAMLCAVAGEPGGGLRHHGVPEGSHGLGIPLVPQFGGETDDALRQNIGFLERRKMATRLSNCPAPEIEELLCQ